MKKAQRRKTTIILLLIGWCLLFLRCDTTEKSMVRALYLAQTENGFCAGLLYQAPEAEADAAEASATLQYVQADGKTLEQAIANAEEALPQTASYRLCDFLLVPDAGEAFLTEYEQLVLRRGYGRTAAKLVWTQYETDTLTEQNTLPDALMDSLKTEENRMPRLYQHRETILLPCLQWNAEKFHWTGGLLHTTAGNWELSAQQTELFALLTNTGKTHSFWLEREQVSIRRCTVSVDLQNTQTVLRLDCQRASQSPLPTEMQQMQLAQACTVFVQACWQQGVDVLHLSAYAALQNSKTEGFMPTKNACPQLRTDVRFLPI